MRNDEMTNERMTNEGMIKEGMVLGGYDKMRNLSILRQFVFEGY
jgi:hypothetical protein